MINEISIAEILESNESLKSSKPAKPAQPTADEKCSPQKRKFILLPFYFNGKKLENSADFKSTDFPRQNFPRWGITLLAAGSMRFRWNETNENRGKVFTEILSQNSKSKEDKTSGALCERQVVPLELIHSKTVVEAKNAKDTKNVKADGIITKNRNLVPSVTVADCVPIYLYDTKTGAIGIFHSGWKGTGIAGEGVKKMRGAFGSNPEDICAAIGPHIGKCCYFIDEERAEYFSKNFGGQCVSNRDLSFIPASTTSSTTNEDLESKKFPYFLSLTQANLTVLRRAGIKDENIVSATDCTCCEKFSGGKNIFGSFRREAAFLPAGTSQDEKSRRMTVQAAFIL